MKAALLQTNESLAQRIAATAAAFPERNALFVNGRYYSYSELMKIVLQIRANIPEDKLYARIGIYCTNDVYTYASLIAINLYGAVYVPLNPKFPAERNKKIIEICKPDLILGAETITTENPAKAENITQEVCYILFTSGSTGEPKGVPVSNENVRHFFNYFLKEYDFNEEDKFLQTYELSFDVSVFSFFMPLLVGACCYVLPDEGIKPVKIAEALKKYNISVVSMVPGVLNYLENYLPEIELPSLRYSFFSGDALLLRLAVNWKDCLPNGVIHNFYGPTETTIVCTRYIFDEQASAAESVNGIVPLGKAFEGMETLIVDEQNNSAEKGELCFSGAQVIANYLDKNEDRFFNYAGKRYYKTGDVASVNSNGNLIFHGRNDSQVKIKGYRVELGETEHAVSKITGCNCIVIYNQNGLLAFVETPEINTEKTQEALTELLPVYMIPKRYIAIEKFPTGINGKVDKKALINAYL